MRKAILIAVAFIAVLASCSLDGTGLVVDPAVYEGGSYLDNGVKKACYWINDVRYELDGEAVETITVSGGKVYSAGYYRDGETLKACYWINKSRYDLPECTVDGYFDFGEISIDHGNVYIVGSYNHNRCYWVNGVRFDPPAGGSMNDAYAANGSLYISGYYLEGTTPKPCYWVNGQRYDLPNIVSNNQNMRYGSTVLVDDNTVYLFGYFTLAVNGYLVGDYLSCWVNRVQQKVIASSGVITGIAISNGDVYMTGQAGLYINGELLSNEAGPNGPGQFAVSRGKIYYAGMNSDSSSGAYANCIFVEE